MYAPSPLVVPAHPCCLRDLIRLVSPIICEFVLNLFWEATDTTVYYCLVQGFRPLIFHLALTYIVFTLRKWMCVYMCICYTK